MWVFQELFTTPVVSLVLVFVYLKAVTLFLQIPLFGGLLPFRKDLESRLVVEEGVHLASQHGTYSLRNSFAVRAATKTVLDGFSSSTEPGGYLTSTLGYSPLPTDEHHSLRHMESYNLSTVPEGFVAFAEEQSTEASTALVTSAQPETLSSTDIIPENFNQYESLASTKASVGDLFAGINDSFKASINQGENALRSSLDTVTSFGDSVVKTATKSVDNAFSKAFSAVDQTGDIANNKLTSFSSGLSGVTNKAPAVAIDALRRVIVVVESSVTSGASYVVYLYGSAKDLLPAGIRDTVNVYEDKATEILRPVGSATQRVLLPNNRSFNKILVSQLYLIHSLNFTKEVVCSYWWLKYLESMFSTCCFVSQTF